MKTVLTSAIIFMASGITAQTVIDEARAKLKSEYEANDNQLISYYAFRKLKQQQFSKITTGEENFTKTGRYASLSLKPDESKFAFVPFTLVLRQDPAKGPFHSILSVETAGSLNADNVFELKEFRSAKVGVAWTYVGTNYKFYEKEKERFRPCRDAILDKTSKAIKEKYQAEMAGNCFDYRSKREGNSKAAAGDDYRKSIDKKYIKEFNEEVAKQEIEIVEDVWTRRFIWWFKLNVNFAAWDNLKYIDSSNAANYTAIKDSSIFTPNLIASIHGQLYATKRLSLYGNVWVSPARKQTFSEIYKPVDWYKHQVVNDTVSIQMQNEKAFLLNPNEFKIGWVVDGGAQIIGMLKATEDFSIGFDLSGSYKSIPMQSGNGHLLRYSAGIVIPFVNSDGESDINVSLFHQWDNYRTVAVENKSFWGVRFALPIHSL